MLNISCETKLGLDIDTDNFYHLSQVLHLLYLSKFPLSYCLIKYTTISQLKEIFFKSIGCNFFSILKSSKAFTTDTLPQCPGWIHSGEFPGENLVCKITGLFTSPAILHDLIHPEENTESLIVPSEFLNFSPISFDITPVTLLSPWCVAASLWDRCNSR